MSNSFCGMIKLSDKLYVSFFSFVAMIPVIICQGAVYSLIFISAVALHEFSHIFFLCRFGAPITKVSIFPFGIDILADTSRISYKKELICTLSGSFANLISAAAAALLLYIKPTPHLLFFIICSIFLGTLNLIPLSFFDGGKALRLLLYDCIELDRAYYIHRSLDVLSAFILAVFSVFLLLASGFNISVCAVIIYAAVSTLAGTAKQKTP